MDSAGYIYMLMLISVRINKEKEDNNLRRSEDMEQLERGKGRRKVM